MGYIEDLRKLIGQKRIVLNGSLVIIENKDGKILMQKRTYPKGKWGLPGGLMELGESTVETAVREVREETNLTVENLKLLGVYSGKDFSGTLMINDGESQALEWFCPEEIPENIPSTHRLVIDDYKNGL